MEYVDVLEGNLKEIGKGEAFVLGWISGEFDGLYVPDDGYDAPTLREYDEGFKWGQAAAVFGSDVVLDELRGTGPLVDCAECGVTMRPEFAVVHLEGGLLCWDCEAVYGKSYAIDWVLAELAKSPEAMKRAGY